jgi:tetratricopeptide (TPR) repeat protein
MGDVYLAQENFLAAIEAYRNAMQVEQGSRQVLQTRQRLVETYPDRVDLRGQLALAYAGMGRREAALQELQTALDLVSVADRATLEKLMEAVANQ